MTKYDINLILYNRWMLKKEKKSQTHTHQSNCQHIEVYVFLPSSYFRLAGDNS